MSFCLIDKTLALFIGFKQPEFDIRKVECFLSLMLLKFKENEMMENGNIGVGLLPKISIIPKIETNS